MPRQRLLEIKTHFMHLKNIAHNLIRPRIRRGRFANHQKVSQFELHKIGDSLSRRLERRVGDAAPRQPVPVQQLTRKRLLAAADNTVYRLGHSTVLMKLDGEFWLTDPVFCERAFPVQWAGPKRFHPSPIAPEDLPPIKAVLLSHDHYDHLDKAAIARLAHKVEHFLTPLGVGDLLREWGVDERKIRQFDWWESGAVDKVQCVATPAQHFSGRGARDSNKRLWCSWTILTGTHRIFFSGDSGYFAGFREVGDHYGPFDLTLIETGAYDRNWVDVHMLPEQSLQAHLDLRGKCMLPIHNGTFDLSIHPWYEPFERVYAAAETARVQLATPRMGQAVSLGRPPGVDLWWRELLEPDLVAQLVQAPR